MIKATFLFKHMPGLQRRIAQTPVSGGRAGFALVLVLAFLVLITALVIAFFSSVTTELTGARNYSSEATTRQLADSSVQMVMGIISQATSGGTTVAWASQPGMIRTYDNTGAPLAYYKLYSSDNIVVSGTQQISSFLPANDVDPQWNTKPALFTDLNTPVTSGTSLLFPILDGNNLFDGSTLNPPVPLVKPVSSQTYLTYIVSGATPVQGFYIAQPATYNSAVAVSSTNNDVPMPVKWLYVLQNGAVIAPDPTSTGTATFTASSIQPSGTNAIVGRIAFWTDDECAKVNVNTASSGTFATTGTGAGASTSWTGTFWDTPHEFTYYDRSLGSYQPYQNEFQRYPGHPATTDLDLALGGNITPSNIYNICPRYNSAGGSQLATVAVPNNTAGLTPMALKFNRLYSTVDELMFVPNRNPQPVSTTATLTESQLEQSRFFITANSRAPEVNLFNEPRVALWPINSQSGSAYRTAEDQLIAFCSTIDGNPYYFQRSDPTSPTNDYTNITRNPQLFQYLQGLTGAPVPGFGGGTAGFLTKYPGERDQILTEMFDYIRCTDIEDQGVTSPFVSASNGQVVPIYIASSDTMGFGRFALPCEVAMDFVCVGTGTLTTTSGTTVTTKAAVPVDSRQIPGFAGVDGKGTPDNNTMAIQGCLAMSFMDPAMGVPTYTPSFTVQVSGLNQFKIGETSATIPMGFPSSGATLVSTGSNSGGLVEPTSFVANKLFDPTDSDPTKFPFYSNIIEVPYSNLTTANNWTSKFAFAGGNITINIYAGNKTDAAHLVQTISNLPITSGTYYVPGLPDPALRLMGTGTPYTTSASNADRFVDSPGGADFDLFGAQINISPYGGERDTVQSVVISHGDARMLFRHTLNNSTILSGTTPFFIPDDSISTGDGFQTVNASFTTNQGDQIYQRCNTGQLVNGLTPNDFFVPGSHTILKTGGAFVNNDPTMPLGDWDSGIASMPDGPYINKPDEGDLTANSSKNYLPYYAGWTTYTPVTSTFFSPNRQVPSAGMFGSLPTGLKENLPWRTLLFRPDIASLAGNHHPGAGVFSGTYNGTSNAPGPYSILPDHLFMDLFWMPVVEPYPISDPFATAGKVNMNYQIAPFSYINRETAVRAVLKSERPLAVPSVSGSAKSGTALYTIEHMWKDLNNIDNMSYDQTAYTPPEVPAFKTVALDWRYNINLDETLNGFRQRFAANDLFRSASEICLIPLVPTDNPGLGYFNPNSNPPETYSSMCASGTANFWYNHVLSGDNVRERPYANIYPRLTTKSNTFTVHYRVQTLQKLKNDPNQSQWVEGRDQIIGEYRGSSIVERYIDPSDTTIPDYATASNPPSLDSYYKFRVLSTKRFAP